MTVPTSSLIAMGAAAAFCVLLPIGILIWWRRTERVRLLPALWGALTFLLFARGLETGLHYLCILSDNAVSRVILSSPWLYMLYGALAAGIFEECGRFCMYKTVMRRYDGRAAAVTASATAASRQYPLPPCRWRSILCPPFIGTRATRTRS